MSILHPLGIPKDLRNAWIMYSEVTLGNACFLRSGTVKFGSYTYDEPSDDKNERILPFGEVPAILYSEAMGDLQRIAAGKADTQEA